MSDAEDVVFALVSARESADAFPGAELLERFLSSGDHLVGVCLMAYVEHKLVSRCIEYVMGADYQFDGTQAGSKVARIMRTAFHDIAADVAAQLFQLPDIQFSDIGRNIYLVQYFVHIYFLFDSSRASSG